MKHRIIGIAGPAQVGKDTVARIIQSMLSDYREIKSFADPMKDMLAKGLGLTHDQLHGSHKEVIDERYECTPRHIMQTIGTEWGRNLIHPDIWVHAMLNATADAPTIIPDVRFENEAEFVRENGVLIHVKGRGGIEGGHVSEKGVRRLDDDHVIYNTGDVSMLRYRVRRMIVEIEL